MDEALVPLFELLWSAGIRTALSCQCHPPTGKVWISFASGEDAGRFLTSVMRGDRGDGWTRAEHWYFSAYAATAAALTPPLAAAQHPSGWEFYASVHELGTREAPDLVIHVDVLFPTEDLPRIVENLGRCFGRT